MKQINDKLNKIAKAIDETVELPETDLITDSLDAITKALGGTPNDSNLIVDKLDDIAGVAEPKPTGNIELTENGENIDIAQYATATVNVSGGGGGGDYGDLRWVIPIQECTLTGSETEPNIETVNADIRDYTQSIIFNIYYTEDNVEYCDSYVCEYGTIGDDFYFQYSDDANLLTVFITNDKGTFWFGTPDHQTPYAGDYKISAVGIFKPTSGGGGGNQ